MSRWHSANVLSILQPETYCDLILYFCTLYAKRCPVHGYFFTQLQPDAAVC